MPEPFLTLLVVAYPCAAAAFGYWLARQVDTASGYFARRDRLRAEEERAEARRERDLASAERANAAHYARIWRESWGSSEHELSGRRLADHCDLMQAERDEARREAKEWEEAARLVQSELDKAEHAKHCLVPDWPFYA